MKRHSLIPEKYADNKYVQAIVVCLFLLYFIYFWGYRITPQLLSGNLRVLNNNRAGFSISVSPYWALVQSNSPGIRTARDAVLITNDGFIWRESTVKVNKQRSERPSLDHALSWSNEETVFDHYEFFDEFRPMDLNGREAFIGETRYENKYYTAVVVLGEKNEFVIYLVTSNQEDRKLFQEMIDSFVIHEGF